MDHQPTPSQHGIIPHNPQYQLRLEDIERPSAATDSATQSLHAARTHNHQQPVERALLLQVIPENVDYSQIDDAFSYNSPPAKRQMRDRNPITPNNTSGNGVTPIKSVQISPTKPRPAKVFDTKAEIREDITSAMLAQRKAFLIEKRDYFTPLLPQNNYIQKLPTQNDDLSEGEKTKPPAFVPYQQLKAQPKGIKATLKPYQLSGLSYMVYLYKNGANGILGHDMGLGKTLQTLSLIQYLKANYPTSGKSKLQRPFLIVCPLSVLGSWMTETEKWTDLSAIRFHGGREERSRLKNIIAGTTDKLGNLNLHATRKRKQDAIQDSSGRELISLDRDDDIDEDNAVGVDLVSTTYE